VRRIFSARGMHLFRVLPFLSLLLGARASSLGSRAPHRLNARTTSDTCAFLDTSLDVTVPKMGKVSAGMIDQCLCLSGVQQFVQTNVAAQAAVLLVGLADTTNDVTKLIGNSRSKSTCVYPDNSVPACTSGNVCGFSCTNGYNAVPANKPTSCVCNAPSVVCNGQCVAAGLCPSSVPVSKKRSLVGSCTDMGPGWAACAVPGGGRRAWECINTVRDLESCGGCMYPLTVYSPIGTDCSTLPGVADVSCLGGECVVRRCLRGYVPARDGTSCIRKHSISQYQIPDAENVPARAYGLEHFPLGRY